MKYRVEVVQTNVFWFDADNAEEARRIASEDYIWDEDQSGKNTYGVHLGWNKG
tara:strand:+ start:1298 stop:1456 length:159 start_codon:yes stop_codon:yes gene_type:complete